MLHIERAETYWERAKHESDIVLFTDVIYRTNQAFEGMLKEAYSVLAEKKPSRIAPHKIEEYLSDAGLFKERVLSAFTNYRTEWRNKSTHDYTLFFSEQEALLAINSVSAFCVILLDQIVTKANKIYERERAKLLSEQVKSSIDNYNSLNLSDRAKWLLVKSYEYIDIPQPHLLRELEFLGLLSGFIEAVDTTIKVQTDVLLNSKTRARADLILADEHEKVIVELKRTLHQYNSSALNQLMSHMDLSETKYGIIMSFDGTAKKGEAITQNGLFESSPKITFIRPTSM